MCGQHDGVPREGKKMMRHSVMIVASGLMLAVPVAAQEARAWPQRMFLTIDVPFQPLNNDFSESLTFADALRRSENVTFVAGYDTTRGALFDIGGGWRLTHAFGAGLTASWFRQTGSRPVVRCRRRSAGCR